MTVNGPLVALTIIMVAFLIAITWVSYLRIKQLRDKLHPHSVPSWPRVMSGDTHLDIEQPLFLHRPHIWVQWKGTEVCADVYCACGASMHADTEFFYFFQCPGCKRYWEVGTHVAIYEVDAERVKGSACVYQFEDDEVWSEPDDQPR
jgi:hypothetical protein